MTFISLTRLRIRSKRYLPSFFWHTWWSARQAKASPGFLNGRLARDSDGAFWTVTIWENEAAMRAFRIAGAHMRAMPKLLDWCDEASIAHWEQEGDQLPDGDTMHARMREIGRISKVRYPSDAHAAKQTAPNSGAPQFGMNLQPR